ncbi:MAG: hypothetical protein QF515_00600 [Pseudomonadales bacterium]|nr:hypothetical protein [Pseudomonadales bacterium]
MLESIFVEPSARHHDPVQKVFREPRQRHALCSLVSIEPLLHPALRKFVEILRNQFRIRQAFAVDLQKRQLALGCFTGIAFMLQFERYLKDRHQHFRLETERARIPHSESEGAASPVSAQCGSLFARSAP